MTDVRVLIVDDQLPFREARGMVVEMTDDFEVVGEAENGEQGVDMAASLRPDLVLMDVQMPGIDGLEATGGSWRSTHPPHVLVMSTHESGSYEEPALAAGAIGVPSEVDVQHGRTRSDLGDGRTTRASVRRRRVTGDRHAAGKRRTAARTRADRDRAADSVEAVGDAVQPGSPARPLRRRSRCRRP